MNILSKCILWYSQITICKEITAGEPITLAANTARIIIDNGHRKSEQVNNTMSAISSDDIL